MALRVASQSGPEYPPWASSPLAVGGGHERALAPLLALLLDGTVGGTFADVLILLRLAFEAVKDRSDRLLARGVAGGSWGLTSQLMN